MVQCLHFCQKLYAVLFRTVLVEESERNAEAKYRSPKHQIRLILEYMNCRDLVLVSSTIIGAIGYGGHSTLVVDPQSDFRVLIFTDVSGHC